MSQKVLNYQLKIIMAIKEFLIWPCLRPFYSLFYMSVNNYILLQIYKTWDFFFMVTIVPNNQGYVQNLLAQFLKRHSFSSWNIHYWNMPMHSSGSESDSVSSLVYHLLICPFTCSFTTLYWKYFHVILFTVILWPHHCCYSQY